MNISGIQSTISLIYVHFHCFLYIQFGGFAFKHLCIHSEHILTFVCFRIDYFFNIDWAIIFYNQTNWIQFHFLYIYIWLQQWRCRPVSIPFKVSLQTWTMLFCCSYRTMHLAQCAPSWWWYSKYDDALNTQPQQTRKKRRYTIYLANIFANLKTFARWAQVRLYAAVGRIVGGLCVPKGGCRWWWPAPTKHTRAPAQRMCTGARYLWGGSFSAFEMIF